MLTAADFVRDPIQAYPTATVACFDPTEGELPRRRLAVQRTEQFLERLSAVGAPAVLIAASTGHGHLRTIDELAEWLRVAAAAKLGNTVKMALLRPEDGEPANRRLVDLAADLNYPVVFVRPGKNLAPSASDDEVAANMQPIVQAAAERGLAVGLYSIPDVSGLPMSPTAAAKILAGPGGERVVAIKVTEANFQTSTAAFLSDPRLQHLKIVQGWDPHFASALQAGPQHDPQGRQRCGVTSGPMSFAIFQYLHMFDAAARGDWSEVEAAQQAVTQVFESMQDDPRKFADLQRAKFIMGLGQPLTGEVTSEQVERVFVALQSIRRAEDKARMIASFDLMQDGPFHERLGRM